MMRIKRLETHDKPGVRLFNSYSLIGIDQAYYYEVYNPWTMEVLQCLLPFFMLKAEQRKIHYRSKYTPHQKRRECDRRVAQARS